jgi:hypothetical protein
MRLYIAPALLAASVFAGCGLVSDNFDAELKVNFTVDGTGRTYDKTLSVNPADYQDVQQNCDSVEKSTGQIRSITIEILSLNSNNNATYGSGKVFMKAGGTGEFPTEPFAEHDLVPLIAGQSINLDMTPARRAAIAELVFTEHCDKPVDVKLIGEADREGVAFEGKVTFFVDFIASI